MALGFAVFLLDVVLAMYCFYMYEKNKNNYIWFAMLYSILAIIQGFNLVYWK